MHRKLTPLLVLAGEGGAGAGASRQGPEGSPEPLILTINELSGTADRPVSGLVAPPQGQDGPASGVIGPPRGCAW
eukprot:CAMPEP_0180287248 /NCGR_PEP_ID=MMETSP0988-20121125/13210_1 /TAXON_ID=697907 /ORGANISM="non described non described, Strain CCMP2293" /LENGTH=74 /DNA_ID=CAMNT_0022261439 /DNA_START=110 /DNA_END=331 /DNA_ORIENTATION=+